MHGAIAASHGSGIRSVSATRFEFISENRQVAWARDFVESLPGRLVG